MLKMFDNIVYLVSATVEVMIVGVDSFIMQTFSVFAARLIHMLPSHLVHLLHALHPIFRRRRSDLLEFG